MCMTAIYAILNLFSKILVCIPVRGSDGGGFLEYIPSSLSMDVHTSIRRCMHGGHEVNSYNYYIIYVFYSGPLQFNSSFLRRI